MAARDEARLLDAALARGWLEQGDIPAQADGPAGRFGARVQQLVASGRLDPVALAALAEELGVSATVQDRSTRGAGPTSALAPPVGWERYQRLERLGSGGGGEVFRAHDPRLARDVALKFLTVDRPDRIERFRREAQAQARVEHANVCKVYEVGEVDGKLYIAMQYLAGGTLAEVAPGLPLDARVRLCREVALAVHAAHRLGIVHRDLKPSNVMIERGEDGELRPYVVDFGLARELESGTTVSGVVGTPGYMAPEQARGDVGQSDRRTDVYGLGALLFSVLVGRPPFEGPLAAVLASVLADEPPGLRQLRPELPRDLETICARCLDKQPERRYPSAKALADELGRFLDGEPILARPRGLAVRLWRRARRHKLLALALVAGVVAAGVLTWLLVRSESRARQRAGLAQRFGQEARSLESIMRYAYMLPLHDIRREQALVRQQMERVRAEMRELGAVAEGPGNYALGRGLLALHDFAGARTALERAWANGSHEPEVAYALGQAYGGLYLQAVGELASVEDPARRHARRGELALALRTPAVRYLGLSRGSVTDSPAYLEAQLALYQDRYAEALAQTAKARAEVPWLYEAKQLEGEIQLAQLDAAEQAGHDQEARALAPKVKQALAAAEELARSDDAITRLECQYEAQSVAVESRFGKLADGDFVAATAPCDRALIANPDGVEVLHAKAEIVVLQAEAQAAKGQDPRATLARAVALASQALLAHPDHAGLLGDLGAAYARMAEWETVIAGDPAPLLGKAIASLERAKQRGEDPSLLMDLGRAYFVLAADQRARSLPWQASFDHALASFRAATDLEPDGIVGLLSEADAYESSSDLDALAGLDPRPKLALALAAYQRALEVNPQSASALAERGSALAKLATYQSDHGIDAAATVARASDSLSAALASPSADHETYRTVGQSVEVLASELMGRGQDPLPLIIQGQRAMTEARRLQDDDPNDDVISAELWLLAAQAQHRAGASEASSKGLAEARVVIARAIAGLPGSEALNTGAKVEYYSALWRIGGPAAARTAVERGLALSERALATGVGLAYGFFMRGLLRQVAAELTSGPARTTLQGEAERDLARSKQLRAAP